MERVSNLLLALSFSLTKLILMRNAGYYLKMVFKSILFSFCLSISMFSNFSGNTNSYMVKYSDTAYKLCIDKYYIELGLYTDYYFSFIYESKLYNRLSKYKQKFIKDNLRSWIDVSIQYNIPLQLIVAQACIESGFGQSYLYKKYNAMYGIKSYKRSEQKSEELYDNLERRHSRYRAYNKVYDSVLDHARLISVKYSKILGLEWEEAIITVKKLGYATDPNYVAKLNSIIKQLNLDKL